MAHISEREDLIKWDPHITIIGADTVMSELDWEREGDHGPQKGQQKAQLHICTARGGEEPWSLTLRVWQRLNIWSQTITRKIFRIVLFLWGEILGKFWKFVLCEDLLSLVLWDILLSGAEFKGCDILLFQRANKKEEERVEKRKGSLNSYGTKCLRGAEIFSEWWIEWKIQSICNWLFQHWV